MRHFLPLLLLLVAGCSVTRQEQAETVQQDTTKDKWRTILEVPALAFETPAGTVTTQPATIVQTHEGVTETASQTKEVRHAETTPELSPMAKQVAAQVVASSSGGALGWIAAAVGGITTLMRHFAAVKAQKVARQTVRGMERAKDKLGDKWIDLRDELMKSQDEDVRLEVDRQTKPRGGTT